MLSLPLLVSFLNAIAMVSATPVSEPSGLAAKYARGDRKVLRTEAFGNATAVWYGEASSVVRRSESLAPRQDCPNRNLVCDTSNQARNVVCKELIPFVRSYPPDAIVGTFPREICLFVDNQPCCVSWATEIADLRYHSLLGEMENTYNTCGGDNGQFDVSGKQFGTNLRGVCTDQCMSNRGTSC